MVVIVLIVIVILMGLLVLSKLWLWYIDVVMIVESAPIIDIVSNVMVIYLHMLTCVYNNVMAYSNSMLQLAM